MDCKLANPKEAGALLQSPCTMMGLRLANPVGIAAGLDRTGQIAGAASAIGFGHLEIGSVTPENLNSALANLQRRATWPESEIVGVNVSCMRDAEGNQAISQYVSTALSCLPFSHYLVLNQSSPFTSRARASGREWRETLLGEVAASRDQVQTRTGRRVPLAIKVSMAPDDEEEAFEALCAARALGFEGVVAATPSDMTEVRVQEALRRAKTLIADMTLVSVGGIVAAAQVQHRLRCGAGVVQILTAIVECGPLIARRIVSELAVPRTASAQSHGEVP